MLSILVLTLICNNSSSVNALQLLKELRLRREGGLNNNDTLNITKHIDNTNDHNDNDNNNNTNNHHHNNKSHNNHNTLSQSYIIVNDNNNNNNHNDK